MKHRIDVKEKNGHVFGKYHVMRMRLVLLSVTREVWGTDMCTVHHFPTNYAISYLVNGHVTLHSPQKTLEMSDNMLYINGPGNPPIEITVQKPSEIFTVMFAGTAAAAFHQQLPPDTLLLRMPNSGAIYSLFRSMLATAQEREFLYEEICRKFLETMMLTVQSGIMRNYPRYDRAREHVVRIKQIIDKDYETIMDTVDIPAQAGISQEYITRLFKKYEGISPYRYLQNLKIHKAASLLVSTERSAAEVGAALGYIDPSVFSRCFKRVMGISPQRYRELARSGERPMPTVSTAASPEQ
ncbi:MAG: helix-turn-helix transcriptional regulator [Spirochaetes bacterium]|nr:helix-turn-helix transcriptional regulator [Spirochaetota bacterium]